jgi:hypothetical protein
MSLRLIVSQSLAALFVAALAFGPTPASADEDPVVVRPPARHHYPRAVHHHHHVQQPVVYQVSSCGGCGSPCGGCGTYVAPQPVYVPPPPVQYHTCGCGHSAWPGYYGALDRRNF